jgi:MFS family permease
VLIGTIFAASTLLTPHYVIYKQQFGFSQITLTLVFAVYVLGNLCALLVFRRVSHKIGRRVTALSAIAVGIVSAAIFLLAQSTAWLYGGRILSGLGIGVAAGSATAWLAELIGGKDKTRATALATSSNFIGLGCGALLAGLVAEYAPWPLHLPFAVYLVALLIAAFLVARAPKTVRDTGRGGGRAATAAVPRAIRAQFVVPTVTGFGTMAIAGFYAALEPTILADNLNQKSHAVAGLVFFELCVVVALTVLTTQQIKSRTAMLWSLALMLPSVALTVAAQVLASMTVMIAAATCCAVATGLGYRGSSRS